MKKSKIAKELVGRKIKAVDICTLDGLSVAMAFTDGTSFSFVLSAKPEVELMFAYSDADSDEIREVLEEQ